ncbi:HlyD family secretion protein [Breznakibacter xylanolyticus]|uniref:HlyD family secretion protein n=1 Tax=Breznakibacter xylanolyticus TaxID=990 RepID=A0A2W7NL93_9BACT|nr:efflux RND transporter periplasmic adaptor subunit [Breznakibacter xylanolyticus]PZX20650.1 HlyD family secretion protein [Breznakibacter xylanolyticus]
MKKNMITAIALVVLLGGCATDKSNVFEGKVKRETISIAPKYAGRIERILVKEGDRVKAGDTLAILEIPEVEAKKMQAEGALHAATWQYQMAVKGATAEQKDQVNAMFKAAKEQYEFAEKSLARVRNLYNDSLVAPQAYDEALTKYQMAQSQYEAALAKRQEVMGGLRDEQVQMALGQKKQAEGAVKEAGVVLSERFVIAPADMTIETLALREGELALPGYNLVVGYDARSTWFRFTISEGQIARFVQGQKYHVTLPFEQNRSIEATLVSVTELAKYGNRSSSYPNHEPGEAVYELKLVPVSVADAANLFTNYSVNLTIQ